MAIGNLGCMQDSRAPLHWAASAGHLDVVTYLLANDAEVDKTDDSGWTALHIAGGDLPRSKISDEICLGLVSAGQEEVVRELVGAGADVKRKNDKGITPLFVIYPWFTVSVSNLLHGRPVDTMRRQSHESKSELFSTLSGTTVLITL
jgi:26S proteasome non-ATPase regulatory subunit 10